MKVTANIASYPSRENSLNRMLASIKGQFDSIRISVNNPSKFGDIVLQPGDTYLINSQETDLTDNGKFDSLDLIQEPEYYFTLDDDLIYPPDYVKRTIEAIEKYKCIVSYHGRQLLGTGINYYTGHKTFRCLNDVISDEMVDVVSTGVTAFDTIYFHPKGLANSPDQKMSDLIFSLEAAKQGKQMGVLNHSAGWITPINNKETIHATESIKPTPRQNQIANEIFNLRYGI